MKVGILTFHRAENFGAVLQAFALQTFLVNKGCDVSIIDYRNRLIEAMYDIFNPKILLTRKNIFVSLHLYFHRLSSAHNRKICKDKYCEFRNTFFRLTEKTYNVGLLAKDFDCIVAGSDQIWNLHLTGGLDRNYFLGYIKELGMKKISYAVSAEKDPCNLLFHHRKELSKLLDDFDYLSVREEFLKDELKKYTLKNIEVCLDPTFLLRGEEYRKITSKPLRDKYILVYHMTPIQLGSVLADNIAKSKGLKVIEIHVGYGFGKSDERHKVNLGPLEILSYITWAEVVITSSFHGLALSLILKKNVWVVDKGNNLRQRNLLSSLKLENRLLSGLEDYEDSEIDYTSVGLILDTLVKTSENFICNAIFDENEKSSILS